MALMAKASEFRRKAVAAGTIRTKGTMSPEKAALQKFADWSPNAFLRWVLISRGRLSVFTVASSHWITGYSALCAKAHCRTDLFLPVADFLPLVQRTPKSLSVNMDLGAGSWSPAGGSCGVILGAPEDTIPLQGARSRWHQS